MRKQAILILAHQFNSVLKTLIKQFDSDFFDIYIHFDQKSFSSDVSRDLSNSVSKSRIYIISTQKVTWAAPSVMKAELDLMKYATTHGEYQYYHLLSGQDLAVKNVKDIYDFFANQNDEFFEILDVDSKFVINRLQYRFPLAEHVGKKHGLFWFVQRLFLLFQKGFRIKNQKQFIVENKIVYSSQWASMTENFVDSLVSQYNKLISVYGQSSVPDEMYKSTFLLNSPSRFKYKNNNYRYKKFNGNSPEIINSEEKIEQLLTSENMFARKFDNNQHLLDFIVQKTKID